MQSESVQLGLPRDAVKRFAYQEVIDDICDLNWSSLVQEDLINVAWAYYHFSVQFRENVEIARSLYPDDQRLLELDRGERNTDNLSPWPDVAAAGERMHHDEFMRRTLELATISEDRKRSLAAIGQAYLTRVRAIDDNSRAMALASYEDGGLERVFRAMLTAQHWNDAVLRAFRHFLSEHIRFDSDPEQGHGALCRHLTPDERVMPLWAEFKEMLIETVPQLTHSHRALADANVTWCFRTADRVKPAGPRHRPDRNAAADGSAST